MAKRKSFYTVVERPVTKVRVPELTWKQVVPYNSALYVNVPKVGEVRMPIDLARKRMFFKVVGKNLMVMSQQCHHTSLGASERARGDYSPIGEARLATLKPTTKVADFAKLMYPQNKFRAATSAEVLLYQEYTKERDAFYEKERKAAYQVKLESG